MTKKKENGMFIRGVPLMHAPSFIEGQKEATNRAVSILEKFKEDLYDSSLYLGLTPQELDLKVRFVQGLDQAIKEIKNE